MLPHFLRQLGKWIFEFLKLDDQASKKANPNNKNQKEASQGKERDDVATRRVAASQLITKDEAIQNLSEWKVAFSKERSCSKGKGRSSSKGTTVTIKETCATDGHQTVLNAYARSDQVKISRSSQDEWGYAPGVDFRWQAKYGFWEVESFHGGRNRTTHGPGA